MKMKGSEWKRWKRIQVLDRRMVKNGLLRNGNIWIELLLLFIPS